MQTKVTVEKNTKTGGSDPTFWLSAAQKVCGVAPASARQIVPLFFFHGEGSPEETHINTGGPTCRSLEHQGS